MLVLQLVDLSGTQLCLRPSTNAMQPEDGPGELLKVLAVLALGLGSRIKCDVGVHDKSSISANEHEQRRLSPD